MHNPTIQGLQSAKYQRQESDEKEKGQDWASIAIDCYKDEHNVIACLSDTKTLHHIPQLYKDTIATDSSRWMELMQVEMDTLKKKHTWDLVKPPPGINIMDSMWVYDIKWDGEENRIKTKHN